MVAIKLPPGQQAGVAPNVGIAAGRNPFFPEAPQPTGIQSPGRTSFQDILPGVKRALGPATRVEDIDIPQVPQMAKVASIPGFDDEFFDSLFGQAQRRLQKQTFGPGGIAERAEEGLASRGLLGSSIEQNVLGDIRTQYGEQLGDVLTDLSRLKTEQAIEDARERRRLQQERDITQAGFGFERGQLGAQLAQQRSLQDAEFDAALKELGIRSALTEAADISKFGLGEFESRIKLEEIAAEDESNRRRLMLDLLSSPQVDLDANQAAAILDSIFGSAGVDVGTGPVTYDDRVRSELRDVNAELAGFPIIERQPGVNPAYEDARRRKDELTDILLGF